MPPAMQQQASTQLADGVPFVCTTQLETALTDQGITGDAAQAIVDVNASARLDALRVAFASRPCWASPRCSPPAASRLEPSATRRCDRHHLVRKYLLCRM